MKAISAGFTGKELVGANCWTVFSPEMEGISKASGPGGYGLIEAGIRVSTSLGGPSYLEYRESVGLVA